MFSRGMHMSVVCEVRLEVEVRLTHGMCWRVGVLWRRAHECGV